MKNISIQNEFGWCNVHVLANVLRDKEFKEYLSNNEYKSGDSDMMNELLKNTGYSKWEIRPMIGIATCYPPIPNDYLFTVLSAENESTIIPGKSNMLVPYFLTVQLKFPYWHSVALLKYKDIYLYIDPYIEDVIVLDSISEIINYFQSCIGIERLVEKDTKEKAFILLDAKILGFDSIFNAKLATN